MYADTDFFLALLKPDDWLGERAEKVYQEHGNDLWTSEFTLIELLLVAYREGLNTERITVNAAHLVEVQGDTDTIVQAATYIEEHGLTPFDALHLAKSQGDTIVSSDETYHPLAPVLDLKTPEDSEDA